VQDLGKAQRDNTRELIYRRILLDLFLSLCFSFDKFGQVLITASNDGHVFVVDPRVTTDFNVLGHTGKQTLNKYFGYCFD
jgi:hypothetical protein